MKDKIIRSFSLNRESFEMLKEISKRNKKTMSSYLDELIRNDYYNGPIMNTIKSVMNNMS